MSPIWVALVSAAIALLSALLASAALAIGWKNYRRDNHKIKVDIQWNSVQVHEHGWRSPIKQRFGQVIVTNTGRRPVTVHYVGLELPGRNPSANWLDESVRLQEGDEPIAIKVAQDSNLETYMSQWKKIRGRAGTSHGDWYKSGAGWEKPILTQGYDLETMTRIQDLSVYDGTRPTKPVGQKKNWQDPAPTIEIDRVK